MELSFLCSNELPGTRFGDLELLTCSLFSFLSSPFWWIIGMPKQKIKKLWLHKDWLRNIEGKNYFAS